MLKASERSRTGVKAGMAPKLQGQRPSQGGDGEVGRHVGQSRRPLQKLAKKTAQVPVHTAWSVQLSLLAVSEGHEEKGCKPESNWDGTGASVKLRNGSGFTQQIAPRSPRCRGRCGTRVLARAWVGDQRTESFYRCPKSRVWFGRPHEASAPLIVLS